MEELVRTRLAGMAKTTCFRFFGWLLPPARADAPVVVQDVSAAFALS